MTQCITISYGLVKGNAKKWHYVQPAIYKQHLTKDGRLIWKYVNHIGYARRSYTKCKNEAYEISKEKNIPFLENVRNNTPV